MYKKAFSLIELMVVIAIVAVLAAVSVPYYQQYLLTTKVSNAYWFMQGLRDEYWTQYYRTGVLPTSVTFKGITITIQPDGNTNFQTVNFSNVKTATLSTSPNGLLLIHANIYGLEGVPGYDPPTTGTGLYNHALLRLYSIDINGVLRSFCGNWASGDPYDIPYSYLPAACRCTALSSIYGANYSACN